MKRSICTEVFIFIFIFIVLVYVTRNVPSGSGVLGNWNYTSQLLVIGRNN